MTSRDTAVASATSAAPVELTTGRLRPQPALEVCRQRRERIAQRLGGEVLVLHGGSVKNRSADTDFRFRPDSDFYYLTGLAEPGAVLVFRPQHEPAFTLFVRPRDAEAEVWSGRRVGPEGALEHFGADAAYPLEALATELPKLLDGAGAVHLPVGRYPDLDRTVQRTVEGLHRRNRTGTTPPQTTRDSRVLLGEDRIVKDTAALASLRRAIDITVHAHVEAMAVTRPGLHEYEIEALLEYEFRRAGSSGPGYGSIVGGGVNATILHYVDNEAALRDGDLLLIDAGAEWDLFSGDLTRTFPVNGRFTPAQKDLYAIVLAANEVGIEQARVGGTVDRIHRACLEVLCRGLLDLGLLEGSLDELLETEKYKRYYMHRTSHWLGADVHDAGFYCLDGKPRSLAPGYVLTIEPGLYVSASDEQAPAELRGCGIRIEDDVLVREEGPEVLTKAAPKTIADLEALVGSRSR